MQILRHRVTAAAARLSRQRLPSAVQTEPHICTRSTQLISGSSHTAAPPQERLSDPPVMSRGVVGVLACATRYSRKGPCESPETDSRARLQPVISFPSSVSSHRNAARRRRARRYQGDGWWRSYGLPVVCDPSSCSMWPKL